MGWWSYLERRFASLPHGVDSKINDTSDPLTERKQDVQTEQLLFLYVSLALMLGIPLIIVTVIFSKPSTTNIVCDVSVEMTTIFFLCLAKFGWNIHTFTYSLMVVFQLVVLFVPFTLPNAVKIAMACIIIFCQLITLRKVLVSGLRLARTKNKFVPFAMPVLCSFYILISCGLLSINIQLNSKTASFHCLIWSCLAFTVASMVGSKVTGAHYSNNDMEGSGKQLPTVIYSYAEHVDEHVGACVGCFLLVFFTPFVIVPVVFFYTILVSTIANQDDLTAIPVFAFLLSIFLLGPSTFLWKALGCPYEIQVRSDASILFMTLEKHYMYHNVTHAILRSTNDVVSEDKLVPFAFTEKEDNVQVLVYLAEEDLILQVTPEANHERFMEAVNRVGQQRKDLESQPDSPTSSCQ